MKTRTTMALTAAALAVGLGAGFGFTHAQADQPHMQSALADLKAAAGELATAERDKGGHRAKALDLTNRAITEVQAGIAVGAGM